MVKFLATLINLLAAAIRKRQVTLLELVGVAGLAVAAGLWFHTPGVFVVVGVAALLKAFELDLAPKDRS